MQKVPENNVVLGTEQHEKHGKTVVYKLARTSMRETEGQSNFGEEVW
jgi:hypothetical protein